MPVIVQTADEDNAEEAALAARITALETTVSSQATAITSLEGTVAGQAATITDLTATVTALSSRVALYDQAAAAVKAILDTAPTE